MAATPGDETEQVIEALKDAFVQGRLGKQEFDKRVGAAFAASAVLRALTADIPAAPSDAAAPDAVPSALTREAYNKGLVARGTAGAAGGVMLAAFIAVTIATGNPFVGFLVGGALGAFMAVILGTLLTLLLWALESPDRRGRPAAEVTA